MFSGSFSKNVVMECHEVSEDAIHCDALAMAKDFGFQRWEFNGVEMQRAAERVTSTFYRFVEERGLVPSYDEFNYGELIFPFSEELVIDELRLCLEDMKRQWEEDGEITISTDVVNS